MILSMLKVEIIGPKKYFYDTMAKIQQFGYLHLEDISKRIVPGEMLVRKMEVDERTENDRRELENLLIKINSILTTLKPEEEEKVSKPEKERERFYAEIWRESCDELKAEIEKLLTELEEKTKALADEKNNLELELATLGKYEVIIEKIKPLAEQLVALEGFETVALLVERKYKDVLDLIREEVSKITKNQFELVSADVDEDTTAALLIFNKIYSELVHSFLWAENVNEVKLPGDLAEKPFNEALDILKEKKGKIPKRIAQIKEELNEISEKWYQKILAIQDVLRDRCSQLAVIHQVGQTDYTFVIEGWIPRKYLGNLKKLLRETFGERVVVSELEVSPEELEEAPVVLENPTWAKPFELVMNLFSPPRYGTIDPTPLLALFYPILFGLIIGDIGYGLLLLLITLYVRKRFWNLYGVRMVASMLSMAAILTIFFGFLYGEIFGDLPLRYQWIREFEIVRVKTVDGEALQYRFVKPHAEGEEGAKEEKHSFEGEEKVLFKLPFDRGKGEYLIPFLFLCVGVGFGHIVLGLILGVVNALKEHAKKHAVEKVGMLIFLFSIFLVIATAARWLPPVMQSFGFFLVLISIVLLIWGGGFMGVMHIFSTFGNILSYARLMALGLAGVVLAVVANQLAGAFGNIYVGLFIALFLHTINLVVHSFSSTIHALRLNVIEFFGKFYESGGKPYKPFKTGR